MKEGITILKRLQHENIVQFYPIEYGGVATAFEGLVKKYVKNIICKENNEIENNSTKEKEGNRENENNNFSLKKEKNI